MFHSSQNKDNLKSHLKKSYNNCDKIGDAKDYQDYLSELMLKGAVQNRRCSTAVLR